MIIETERLILRPWQECDAEALFKYASDPDVGPHAGWAPHTSPEYSREIIRTVFNAPETYAVVLKATGEAVGSCAIMFASSLHASELKPREGEIGYWIGKPLWGQGLIPEAVNALIARGFDELRLNTLWCGYYEGNEKSKRVGEKCGFIYHHTKPNVRSPLGDLRTEHLTRLTKKEYLQNADRTDIVFSSKVGWWIPAVIVFSVATCFVGPMLEGDWGAGAILALITLAVELFVFTGVKYKIRGNRLGVRNFYRWTWFPIHKISSIRPTHSFLSAAALSFDRLAIIFSDKSILKSSMPLEISPRDEVAFTQTIRKINPRIQFK